jgi:hypothetical protein
VRLINVLLSLKWHASSWNKTTQIPDKLVLIINNLYCHVILLQIKVDQDQL